MNRPEWHKDVQKKKAEGWKIVSIAHERGCCDALITRALYSDEKWAAYILAKRKRDREYQKARNARFRELTQHLPKKLGRPRTILTPEQMAENLERRREQHKLYARKRRELKRGNTS
jgi:hypothetical protein